MTHDNSLFRQQFPAIIQMENLNQVYLDSAATTQVPISVVSRISQFYSSLQGNVHRSNHLPGINTTRAFEEVRSQVAQFIGAANSDSIVWSSGATAAVNMVAFSWAEHHLDAGDEILLSEQEHHANLVPWQQLATKKGLFLKWLPMKDSGLIDFSQATDFLTPRVKLIAITHASNVTGVVNPLKAFIRQANNKNIRVLVDGAQSIPHLAINVADLGCDFFIFSAHKLYGPKGLGVLYVAPDRLMEMQPWQTGGEMVKTVTKQQSTFQQMPLLLEAGTPNISAVIGFGAALDFLQRQDLQQLWQHESNLGQYLLQALSQFDNIQILGLPCEKPYSKLPLFSFNIEGLHHFDIAALLNEQQVFVRSGKHCAMPLMKKLSISGSIRVSIGLYNNKNDIDLFIAKLSKSIQLLTG